MARRVFLLVLDSLGIGDAPDSSDYNDKGSNTLGAISKTADFNIPTLQSLGLFNIKGVNCGKKVQKPLGCFAKLEEGSQGKDTTTGHWEMAGLTCEMPFPLFPLGFPQSFIDEFEKEAKCKTICNKPYSGTEVIRDFGEEHMRTGALIVYTSADSVCQIAANEDIVPVSKLYDYCLIARKLLKGKLAVGRVIARPFIGENDSDFRRTASRHDFSLEPTGKTMLDFISAAGQDTIAVGKITDIFAGMGITQTIPTIDNDAGIEAIYELLSKDFAGLAFINLVDFDMLYGHRNDTQGYADAVKKFDAQLCDLLLYFQPDDLLIITADHGCDPSTPSTDHSREYVPMICYGQNIENGIDLQIIKGFTCIAATICEYLGVGYKAEGISFWPKIKK